jgi:hypothetical protein
MREYELVIDEALLKGLSPEFSIPPNSQFLYECLGFRIGRGGLEAFLEGENPLPATTDLYYTWPFPQMLVGETYYILVVRNSTEGEDKVYSVSSDMNTVTLIDTITAATGTGTLMELADFGEYAFMTNGVVMIYWDTTTSTWQTVTSDANIPMMRTVCNFKGQAVGGNIVSDWHDCDEKFYVWSKIGSMDFTPDRFNSSGYRRDPFGGDVLHVRRLGDVVVGYSTRGVTLLAPVSEPATTFGFKEISDVGPINRGAVGGDIFKQLYVGSDLHVRMVTSEGVKDLGYRHLMDNLDDEDIIVNYDRGNGDFFIGNSERTYLLSPQGMSELPQHPSAVWRIDSDNVYMLPDSIDSGYYPLVTTETFDMGYSGQKTISTMEIGTAIGDDPEAAVDYIFSVNNWETGASFKPFNNQGIASVTTAGNEFRFKVRYSAIYDLFRLSYIKVRYKMTDLRGIRGVYAPPLRGQS